MDWKGIIGGLIGALLTAGSFYLLNVLGKIPSEIIIPSGAVVAFEGSKCPTGWSPYNKAIGRVIVGVGKAESGTKYTPELTDGQENIKLQENHLPPETQKIKFRTDYLATQGPASAYYPTAEKIEQKPLNLMQPWIALHYCKKN